MIQKPRVENPGFWHLATLPFVCTEFGQSEALGLLLGSAGLSWAHVGMAPASGVWHINAQTLLCTGTA